MKFGLSELIQTGILFTLLGIAFGLGGVLKRFEMKIDDHDERIAKVEKKVFGF